MIFFSGLVVDSGLVNLDSLESWTSDLHKLVTMKIESTQKRRGMSIPGTVGCRLPSQLRKKYQLDVAARCLSNVRRVG